jgi:hypothetical protein
MWEPKGGSAKRCMCYEGTGVYGDVLCGGASEKDDECRNGMLGCGREAVERRRKRMKVVNACGASMVLCTNLVFLCWYYYTEWGVWVSDAGCVVYGDNTDGCFCCRGACGHGYVV